ncbi:type II toxin-antitoxin system HicB family antitoxin [Enterobacteriaceae bacterium RIT711]|nr:type II toxin-antitoxin system HicB family antitoxin [Enterobacteriaceae bacterium RIT711]
MRYPIVFKCDENVWSAIFPDMPEILTVNECKQTVLSMAKSTLLMLFASYFNNKRIIPEPSVAGSDFIEITVDIAAKVHLLNALTCTWTSQSRLAKKMNIRPQEVRRFVDLNHPTKIDTIEKALNAVLSH